MFICVESIVASWEFIGKQHVDVSVMTVVMFEGLTEAITFNNDTKITAITINVHSNKYDTLTILDRCPILNSFHITSWSNNEPKQTFRFWT